MPYRYKPQTVLIVPELGKFVWEPALQIVDFIKKGKRHAYQSKALTIPGNTKLGATRKATEMLMDYMKRYPPS